MAGSSPLLEIPGMAGVLARVDTELRASVVADNEYLTEIATHLIAAGGKRVRPSLAAATASAGRADGVEGTSDDVVRGAVAVELVHLGSLYHDDVMDDAAMRRGVESVNEKWGNLRAILAGDFLLARASEIASSLGTEVAGLLAATVGRLCEGQVRELQDIYNVDRTEDAYIASIGGKTAALFATACRIGGLAGQVGRDEIDAATEFGRRFGMAFQIVDDVLDVTASEALLGKPSGNDLLEGVYTLPVIRTLASGVGPELSDLLGQPLEPDGLDQALALVRSNGAVTVSLSMAAEYARGASDVIATLEPVPATSAMAQAASDLTESIANLG